MPVFQRRALPVLVPLALLALALAPAAVGTHVCGAPVQPAHRYAGSTWAGVFDTYLSDCNGNFLADDFDGDYDVGFGGAFFGILTAGNADQNAACGFGLHLQAATTVTLTEPIPFAIGYETIDPSSPCLGDGVIDPEEDCLVEGVVSPAPADPCPDKPSVDAGLWILVGDGAVVGDATVG